MTNQTAAILAHLQSAIDGLDGDYNALLALAGPSFQPVPGTELDAATRSINAAARAMTAARDTIQRVAAQTAEQARKDNYRRWTKNRDDYGRTVRTVEEITPFSRTTVGVIISLPKTAHELGRYMINIYGREDVTYRNSLAASLGALGVGPKEWDHYPIPAGSGARR